MADCRAGPLGACTDDARLPSQPPSPSSSARREESPCAADLENEPVEELPVKATGTGTWRDGLLHLQEDMRQSLRSLERDLTRQNAIIERVMKSVPLDGTEALPASILNSVEGNLDVSNVPHNKGDIEWMFNSEEMYAGPYTSEMAMVMMHSEGQDDDHEFPAKGEEVQGKGGTGTLRDSRKSNSSSCVRPQMSEQTTRATPRHSEASSKSNRSMVSSGGSETPRGTNQSPIARKRLGSPRCPRNATKPAHVVDVPPGTLHASPSPAQVIALAAAKELANPPRCSWPWVKAKACHACGWWKNLREPTRKGRLAKFILHKRFEFFCAVVILCNSGFTIYAVDKGMSELRDGRDQQETDQSILVAETVFLGWYVIELLMKVAVHRVYFFLNEDRLWNIFDLFLILMEGVSRLDRGSANFAFIRSFRIARWLRIIRVLRVIRFLRELRTMVYTLWSSAYSLLWCLIFLVSVLLIFGMLFVQAATTYLADHYNDQNDVQVKAVYLRLKESFGSVQKSMVTLYMATTGGEDWRLSYDALSATGEFYGLLVIFFVAFFTFAVYNILTGMIVEHTHVAAQRDSDLLIEEQRRKERVDAEQLTQVCLEMDTDKSGKISFEEFMKVIDDPLAGTLLASIGIDIQDAEAFYQMLLSTCGDPDADEVDIETFVEGCMRLKGHATSIDVQSLSCKVKLILDKQEQFMERMEKLDEMFSFAPNRFFVQGMVGGGCTPIRTPIRRLSVGGDAELHHGARTRKDSKDSKDSTRSNSKESTCTSCSVNLRKLGGGDAQTPGAVAFKDAHGQGNLKKGPGVPWVHRPGAASLEAQNDIAVVRL